MRSLTDRGIRLRLFSSSLSARSIAKMYATLQNSCLTKWAEATDLRVTRQAGFRQDHRCSDHLLVLRTVIEQKPIVKAPLYTCFVDFKKAYDTVPRDMLWTKLQRIGVHGCS